MSPTVAFPPDSEDSPSAAAFFHQARQRIWRSHANLTGSFLSGLQIRKGHRLVTTGVRERARHLMRAAHLLWAVAQLLLLKNVIAGPSFLVELAAPSVATF